MYPSLQAGVVGMLQPDALLTTVPRGRNNFQPSKTQDIWLQILVNLSVADVWCHRNFTAEQCLGLYRGLTVLGANWGVQCCTTEARRRGERGTPINS